MALLAAVAKAMAATMEKAVHITFVNNMYLKSWCKQKQDKVYICARQSLHLCKQSKIRFTRALAESAILSRAMVLLSSKVLGLHSSKLLVLLDPNSSWIVFTDLPLPTSSFFFISDLIFLALSILFKTGNL